MLFAGLDDLDRAHFLNLYPLLQDIALQRNIFLPPSMDHFQLNISYTIARQTQNSQVTLNWA